MKYQNWIKILFGLIGTIILGAIGSGIWELFLSHLADNLISYLLRFLNNFSDNFKNEIYSDVGKGSTYILGTFAMTFHSLFWLLTILLPIILLISLQLLFSTIKKIIYPKRIDKTVIKFDSMAIFFDKLFGEKVFIDDRIKNLKRTKFITFFIMIPLCIWLFKFFLTKNIKDAYSWDVVVYIESSIDILSPFLDDKELMVIKADFRRIKDYNSFSTFNDKLEEFANKNGLELPEISIVDFR